jgi:hypothetical protein
VVTFLTLVGFAVLIAGGFLVYLASGQLRRAALLGIPLVRAAELTPGLRKVRGRVVAVDPPLSSPVSNQACVHYRLRVEQERRKWKSSSGGGDPSPMGAVVAAILGGLIGVIIYRALKTGGGEGASRVDTSWDRILDEAETVRFLIEDATGSVAVDMHDGEAVLKEKARVLADFSHPAPPHLHELLHKKYRLHTVDERGKHKTLNFIEETLKEGSKVTVVGRVVAAADGSLWFQAGRLPLLLSERDVGKQSGSARGWAIGLAAAAGGAIVLGLGLLTAADVLARG